ncbi:MAG: hypothetical protein B7Z55_18290, partial [Planctomycetales bacterium 12-60-4]
TTASDHTQAIYESLSKSAVLEQLDLIGPVGSPTDESLVLLGSLPKLKSLSLSFDATYSPRRYTQAGIDRFRQDRRDVELNVDGTTYPATAPK